MESDGRLAKRECEKVNQASSLAESLEKFCRTFLCGRPRDRKRKIVSSPKVTFFCSYLRFFGCRFS